MYNHLTPIQTEIFKFIKETPATAEEIAERMNYSSRSVVYDHISGIRRNGQIIGRTSDGKYIPLSEVEIRGDSDHLQDVETIRV